MCGICGFINRDGSPAAPAIIRRMTQVLHHRGPDGFGHYVQGPVALGHRRLAIVDLEGGRQPMQRGSRQLVYNGEIYNHQQLRQRMSSVFATHSDTETLLAAYEESGKDCLQHLRGMFAFAVYDESDQTLFLARDRLGIKPLYVYADEKLFAFASEIKSLLAHPAISAELNLDQLPVQLALKYTLDDQTLFRGIRKMPPGHWLRLDKDEIQVQQYWDLPFVPEPDSMDLVDAARAFRVKFTESVQLRLMADVPLGVFLSGGIDSSVIAGCMSRLVDEPIQAFTVAFGENGYSELPYARMVAQHAGLQIHETNVTAEQWLAAWPRMVYHEDEPIAHPSSIPLHFVSALAARHVKVVLTGEGSDELLAGYERYYQTLANLRFGRLLPEPLRNTTHWLINRLPNRFVGKRKAVRTSLYLRDDIESLFLDNYAAFPRSMVLAALRPELAPLCENIFDDFLQMMHCCRSPALLNQLLYADIKTYLVELLMKQDQMSISAYIESRVPFLYHELVELICRLPVQYKLKGFSTKRILRVALGDLVPPEIVSRSKKGFPTPIKSWFRGVHYKALRSLLLSDGSLLHEYINRSFIKELLERHRAGVWDLQEQLWTLGNFELWLRIFINGQDPETIFEPQEDLACASCG